MEPHRKRRRLRAAPPRLEANHCRCAAASGAAVPGRIQTPAPPSHSRACACGLRHVIVRTSGSDACRRRGIVGSRVTRRFHGASSGCAGIERVAARHAGEDARTAGARRTAAASAQTQPSPAPAALVTAPRGVLRPAAPRDTPGSGAANQSSPLAASPPAAPDDASAQEPAKEEEAPLHRRALIRATLPRPVRRSAGQGDSHLHHSRGRGCASQQVPAQKAVRTAAAHQGPCADRADEHGNNQSRPGNNRGPQGRGGAAKKAGGHQPHRAGGHQSRAVRGPGRRRKALQMTSPAHSTQEEDHAPALATRESSRRSRGVAVLRQAATCRRAMDYPEARTGTWCGQQALDRLGHRAESVGSRRVADLDVSGRASRRERPRARGHAEDRVARAAV